MIALAAIRRGPQRLAIRAIRGYQRWLSPGHAPACRFEPSCSEYGAQAIARHGLLGGGARTAWRLLRCNPFNQGGYDPVAPALPGAPKIGSREYLAGSADPTLVQSRSRRGAA